MANNMNGLGINISCIIEDAKSIETKLNAVLQKVNATIKINNIDIDETAIKNKLKNILGVFNGTTNNIPLNDFKNTIESLQNVKIDGVNESLFSTNKGEYTKLSTEEKKAIAERERALQYEQKVRQQIANQQERMINTQLKMNSKVNMLDDNNILPKENVKSLQERINSLNVGSSKADVIKVSQEISNALKLEKQLITAIDQEEKAREKIINTQQKENEQALNLIRNQQKNLELAQFNMNGKVNKLDENNILPKENINTLQQQINSLAFDSSKLDIAKVNREISNSIILENDLATAIKKAEKAREEGSNRAIKEQEAQLQLQKEVKNYQDKMKNSIQNLQTGYGNSVSTTQLDQFKQKLNDLSKVSSIKELQNQTKQLNNEFGGITANARQMTSASNGLFSTLVHNMTKFAEFYFIAGGITTVLNKMTDAFQLIADLDKSQTNIMMITSKSRDEINQLTDSYNDLSSSLHTTLSETMKSAEQFLRAGKSVEESRKLIEGSMEMSIISSEDPKVIADEMIAAMNAFGITADEMEQQYVDKITHLDSVSATSAKDISEAIMHTAQSAKLAGVSWDYLLASTTAVMDVSKKSGSEVGNSFRTIFARMESMAKGGKDEEGQTINQVEKSLNKVGIALRKSETEFRSMEDVLKDVSKRWGEFSSVTKADIAAKLGGVYNRETVLTLMESTSRVNELINEQGKSAGDAKAKMEVYADSVEARTNDIKNSINNLYMTFLNSNALKVFLSQIQNIINGLQAFADASTGSKVAFVAFATTAILLVKNFSAVLTALKTTSIETSALQVLMIGLTGKTISLSGAIAGLKSALTALFLTPAGLMFMAIATAVGVATYAVTQHIQNQRELKQAIDSTIKSEKSFIQAIQEADFATAKSEKEKLDKTHGRYVQLQKDIENYKKQQSELQDRLETQTTVGERQDTQDEITEIINKIKDAEDEAVQLQEIIDGSGVSIDRYKEMAKDVEIFGEFQEAQKIADAQNQVLDQTDQLIDRYLKLASAQNLSAEQQKELLSIATKLKDIYGLTDIALGNNDQAIQTNVGYLTLRKQGLASEREQIQQTLNVARLEAEKRIAYEYTKTEYTLDQIVTRIKGLMAERDALIQNITLGYSDSGITVGITEQYDQENANLIKARDAIYALRQSLSTTGVESSDLGGSDGSYTPPGGSDSDKKDPNDPSNVQNLELKIDRYQNLNAAIDNVNNALAKNKTLQDQANDKDKLSLLNQEISLLNQKRTALNNLLAEQQREKAELESQLRSNGFVVDSITGLISNYQSRLQALQNYANSQSTKDAKQSAIDNVKKIEEAIKTYMDLVHKTMASTKNDILSIDTEIRKIYEEELSAVSDVESKITEVIKKQVEERKQAIEDEKNAKIKALQEAQDAYNKTNSEDDYQENLSNEQQKLSEIQSQIADASRNQSVQGKARLKALMDEAESQQDVIDKMVLDRQRELNNQAFDDQKQAIEDDAEAKTKNLDDNYTDEKVSQIVKQALNTGYFTDINGKMTSIKDAYIDFENRFGEGMTALGDKIKSDFISKLDEARQVMTSLSSVMNNLGISHINDVNSGIFANASNLLSNVNLNLPQITPNLTIPIPNLSSSATNQTPSIVFNEPFMIIQGNVDNDTMPRLQSAISDAIEKFKQSLTNQLQLQGIY